jgi:ribonuclease R
MHARPVAGRGPKMLVVAEPGTPALGLGNRAVARFSKRDDGIFEARIIRALDATPDRVVGIYRLGREGGRLEPTDRKQRTEFRIAAEDAGGAVDGEVVLADVRRDTQMGLPSARIVQRLGGLDEPRAFSLIAIHTHGIPTEFPPEAIALAEKAQPVDLSGREDLRNIPLVTIDGADARDFDDAVFAEPDPEVVNGWHAIVAIADVAWYVRPGDALDRSAESRGNSVYFPDRVVPMLPEALSNELCSLKPAVNRACLAVHLWIDENGHVTRHRFLRGLMRSAARFTYEEAQQAMDGAPSDQAGPLLDKVLRPLYGVYAALDRSRIRRGALELDLPERRIQLSEAGKVAKIEPRARLDSHKLIEELMIAANVAAAETLERLQRPCLYRIHDAPDPVKLTALTEFLTDIGVPGLKLAKGQVIKPRLFNEILRKVAGTPYAVLVPQLVLRSQAQAVYSPMNIGHFGLALRRYAHFTSPIRRYSDIQVHRAIIATLGLDSDAEGQDLVALGEHVSMTERRAATAERSASDRYIAAFLAERVGATFTGRINGVTRAGLFVTLAETGADGLIPIRHLPSDYYEHEEARHRLIGQKTRRIFTLGDSVEVRLAEADVGKGSLRFELIGSQPSSPQRSKHLRSKQRKRR